MGQTSASSQIEQLQAKVDQLTKSQVCILTYTFDNVEGTSAHACASV